MATVFAEISQAKTGQPRASQSNAQMEPVEELVSPRSASSLTNAKLESIRSWPQIIIARGQIVHVTYHIQSSWPQ